MAEADERPSDPDYLWDKSGEPDREVVRLERLLAPLAHDRAPREAPNPAVAVENTRRRRPWRLAAIAAGGIAAAAAVAVVGPHRRGSDDTCAGGDGFAFNADHSVRCERGHGKSGTLAVGGYIETSNGSAEVAVADIGSVELAARSRLSLRRTARDEHRLALDHGKLRARVVAPPRLFVIETPSATAIDLGCEYTLEVDQSGAGNLRVTSGQVELAGRRGALVLVPAGTGARFSREHGVGVPVADAASGELREVAARFDRGEARVSELLAAAGPNDVVTVVNLLALVAPGERELVFDRLGQLSPPPESVAKDSVVAGNPQAIGQWRNAVVESWVSGETPKTPDAPARDGEAPVWR